MYWKPGTQRRRRVPSGEGGWKRPEAGERPVGSLWPQDDLMGKCSGLMRGMRPKDGVRKQRRKMRFSKIKSLTNKQCV